MKINFLEKKNILKIKKIINTKYDYLIIGSGPAAAILSNELIFKKKNKNSKILIIEKGDYNQKFYKKIMSKNLPIKLHSRVFSVGGSSNDWSNISSYFEKFEMENSKNKNLWPLSYKDLTNYYKRLNKKYGFGYEKINKKNLNLPFQTRQFIIKNNPVNFKKFLNLSRIDLIYNCEIKLIDDFKSLSYAYTDKKDFFFSAKKVILCCGGIETINLILNSLKNDKLKKMKNKKIVGKYFMNHPKLNLGLIMYPKHDLIKPLLIKQNINYSSFYGISLCQKIQKKLNLLNSYIRFEKAYSNVTKFLNELNSPVIENYLKKRNKFQYKIRLFCEMYPNKKNLIKITNKKLISNYNFSKNDYKTIVLLSKKILKYFSYNYKKETKINYSLNYINNKSEDASHHLGGLIYSHTKIKTNLNKNLKIYGLQNIYVCGGSVFPTSGSVNPTMTIGALAIRMSDHLKRISIS